MFNLTSCPPVIVATVSGRSYYRITSVLKSLNLSYLSLSPEQAALSNGKIIITTDDESRIVNREDVFLDTQLEKYPLSIKAKILQKCMGHSGITKEQLVIGIDPGKRIGISILYCQFELDKIIMSSVHATVERISFILSSIESPTKIVRIGDGSLTLSHQIAGILDSNFKDKIVIEIVDEYGTSIRQGDDKNRGGIRDMSSARKIAFRKGKIWDSYK
ncbi:hypothetical protein [Candidatus Nitrosocosmicus hydrocola]|uniref:hypothetical protein n=1 Tax=Candidatus Nitrosocosmicus hydrocola TaxID=1826872 RepID=UPI0011E59F21|nr:hypothetical protein [Candidatus Nitrosocosmicus hydrocola]